MRLPDTDVACAVCAAERKPDLAPLPFPHGGCRLRDLPDGTTARVRELHGCSHLRSRLYSLGIVPGTEITVHGQGDGGCRVQLRDTCVVLDCESAGCIMCDGVHGRDAGRFSCGHGVLRSLFGRSHR